MIKNRGQILKRGRPKKRQQIHNKFLYLRKFQPLKLPVIHICNRFTPLANMLLLIDEIEKAHTFSMYTQRDSKTNEVSYIAIEIHLVEQMNSSVLVIDLLNEPDQTTCSFAIIKSLLLRIFDQKKKCFIWNADQHHDLNVLVNRQYFSQIVFDTLKFIQLKPLFKIWYNETHPHKDVWTLTMALWSTFDECIYTVDEKLFQIPRNIQSLVHCCTAITKLSLVIQLNWTQDQLFQFKKYHDYNI